MRAVKIAFTAFDDSSNFDSFVLVLVLVWVIKQKFLDVSETEKCSLSDWIYSVMIYHQ